MAGARYNCIALDLNNDITCHMLHSDRSRAENSACEETKIWTRGKCSTYTDPQIHGYLKSLRYLKLCSLQYRIYTVDIQSGVMPLDTV
jgi:hypothetical protein